MDFVDLDSFRSKYRDITVTAVPSTPRSNKSSHHDKVDAVNHQAVEAFRMAPPIPHVEIIPLGAANSVPSQYSRSKLQQQQQQQLQPKVTVDATSYANEYKQVLARLEYTKYVQAQLQMMSLTNGAGAANATEPTQAPNIADVYSSLLRTFAEMQSNLGPTTIGLRAPKERLLRDIAQARVLVRECIIMLMRDQ